MKHLVRYLRGFSLAIAGLCVLLWLLGWLSRSDVRERPPAYSAEAIAELELDRDVSFDPHDPSQLPVLHVEVDHSEGPSASWWPKNESPILQELVAQGHLPPVEERVGPEPIVMRGVEGIGRYGGTWHRIANDGGDVGVISWRLSHSSLFRWSPLGYPIVPHLAKGTTALNDNREFIIELRRGVRWSDGHPFTADDILYWWNYEELDRTVGAGVAPRWMRTGGKPGRLEKVDDYTIRAIFEEPHGQFIEQLASRSHGMVNSPRHYLSRYHPDLGDKDFIRQEMAAYQLPSPRALYAYMRHFQNPDHPRLWPWIYRGFRSNPPQVFVRNPYYYVVDEAGNQLPYIDRLQFAVRDDKMMPMSFARGQASMQARHVRFENYTVLMAQREQFGTRVLHWYPATRQTWVINPNLTRRIDPNRPETRWKAQLLADKRFRQAMSLAINREAIIDAEYNGLVRPSQVTPGPQSPFHSERLANAFIEHDPERAGALLDELGLDQRDIEGMRTFPDGSSMTFYLDYTGFTGAGHAQFVVDDWMSVGVRAVPRDQSRTLFYTRKDAADFDFNVWSSESDMFPLLEPRYFVPHNTESFYATRWGRWYMNGGIYGDPRAAELRNAEPPPDDHPMRRVYDLYEQALVATDLQQQIKLFREITDIAAENVWSIGISDSPPQIVVADVDMRNIPSNAIMGAQPMTPGNAGIETYYFQTRTDSPGAMAETREQIRQPIPRPRGGAPEPASVVGRMIQIMLIGIGVCLIGLVSLRHPFVLRRLFVMVPTLLIISLVVFSIIQLPPGDFLTSRLIQLQEAGDESALRQVEELKQLFNYEDPVWKQYARWMGVYWFFTFDSGDKGLLQGNMGRSMESSQPVNQLVGDRIMLTVLISLGTILFTWALAIPIGVYSAVRQYSTMDYVLTLLGFIGMSAPGFLLALVLAGLAGIGLGLFSPEFAAQPEWDGPKVLDLMKHIWVPIVVLGIGGTAGMIRIMRANLLDELRKPYVTTARAKGVRPLKLLFKYPVRVALNPFVSGIGHLFPQIVSGGAIVSLVLALPTVGPLMLSALFSQDMYLAGSMLMVLSLLGVFGTLVSDLLLLWLDPRIRYEGGAR